MITTIRKQPSVKVAQGVRGGEWADEEEEEEEEEGEARSSTGCRLAAGRFEDGWLYNPGRKMWRHSSLLWLLPLNHLRQIMFDFHKKDTKCVPKGDVAFHWWLACIVGFTSWLKLEICGVFRYPYFPYSLYLVWVRMVRFISIRLGGPRTLPGDTHEHAPFPRTANLLARMNSEEAEQGFRDRIQDGCAQCDLKYELFSLCLDHFVFFKWQFQALVLLQYPTASVSLPMAYSLLISDRLVFCKCYRDNSYPGGVHVFLTWL